MIRMKSRLFAVRTLLAAVVVFTGCVATSPAADAPGVKKPVLLYSRHYNAVGETRYLPEGNYKDILNRLGAEFDVRVHSQPLNAQTLAGVNVVLIANPSDKAAGTNPAPPHVSGAD